MYIWEIKVCFNGLKMVTYIFIRMLVWAGMVEHVNLFSLGGGGVKRCIIIGIYEILENNT